MQDERKKLWRQLMDTMGSVNVACHLYLAQQYTQRYENDMCGWIVLADVLAKVARFDEAREALRKAEQICPDDKRDFLYHQLGHLYREKGNFRLAEKWYRRAIDLKPSTNHLVFLGACLAKQGRFSEAKRCHRRAIKVASENPDEAWFNLGLILRAEGKEQAALKCFNKAIEFDPEYELAKDARKDILALMKIKATDLNEKMGRQNKSMVNDKLIHLADARR